MAPMPTPRPRARVIPGRRPIAVFYSPANYKEWQKEAAAELAKIDAVKVEGSCLVTVENYATRPKTTKLSAPKPDVDNYAKGVLDAITKDGRFWHDDSQVTDLTVSKRWTTDGARIEVTITPISEGEL